MQGSRNERNQANQSHAEEHQRCDAIKPETRFSSLRRQIRGQRMSSKGDSTDHSDLLSLSISARLQVKHLSPHCQQIQQRSPDGEAGSQ